MAGNRVEYTVEIPIKSSPDILYSYIASASGLSTWFADDVNVSGQVFTFFWDGTGEKAERVKQQPRKMVKFKWLDREEDEFLTFEIDQDELTQDVSLVITDFEDEDEVDDARKIWEVSVDQLRSTIGG